MLFGELLSRYYTLVFIMVILLYTIFFNKMMYSKVGGRFETAGGEDAYVLICHSFHDTAQTRMEMIKDAFDREDYHEYTIQVHALKSSARLIGASELAKLAQELETAGREGDVQRIQQDTDGILKKYVWFYDRLDEIFGERN